MAHQILRTFHIQSGALHIGTKCMSQSMRRDNREFGPIALNETLPLVAHKIFQMHGYFRLSVLIQKEKSSESIDDHFYRISWTGLNRIPKRFACLFRHGNITHPAFGTHALYSRGYPVFQMRKNGANFIQRPKDASMKQGDCKIGVFCNLPLDFFSRKNIIWLAKANH